MVEELTEQQKAAVHNRGGKLLVSAAAGSGKTKVLVERLMTYLLDPHDPADLDEFLIITYTKAAASELRGKIAAKLTERIAIEPENKHLQKQMQRLFLTKISTVHGFCGDILREYAYRLELPADFRVADENECRQLRDMVLSDLLDRAYSQEENEDFLAFVDTQGLGRDDRAVPEIIERVYDSSRCHLDPDGWLEDCLRDVQVEGLQDAAETPWGRYLMEDFQDYLSRQIAVMRQCVKEMEASGGLGKQVMNLRVTLSQMETLAKAECWDDIVKNRELTYGRLVFPKKDVDEDLIARVKAAREACKKGMEQKLRSFTDDSAQVLRDLTQSAAGVRGLVALVRQFAADYSSAKRSRRVLDFSDLEQKTLDLLLGRSRTGPTAAAAEIGRRYREILVDEYQDSNEVQDAIFSALTGEKQNCFLVGDVKQSIYQFRLADPEIFLKKYGDYVPAEEAKAGEGRKILLSKNFRSGPEVVEAVNDVFTDCMRPKTGGLYYGEAEALREGVPRAPLPSAAVELHVLDVEHEKYPEEAAFVAERIDTMLRTGTLIRDKEGLRPVKPEDIVILLRSPGSGGVYFQRALAAKNIRCVSGSGGNLLQTEELQTFRCLLQTIVNPRLDIPLISVLASPVFGFTADELASFRGKRLTGSFYDALLESEQPKAKAFLDILLTLRREARMQSLTALLEQCLQLTRLDSIYASLPGGAEKAANIQTFFKLAADYEVGNQRDLSQFLEHLDALAESGKLQTDVSTAGCVTITSIHKSKGLEYPVVFLCNLSRSFNQESLRAQILCDKELGMGLVVADNQNRVRYPSLAKRAIGVKMKAESISEEMRVLYVAMTRARDRLVMTYAVKNPEKDLSQIALRRDFDNGELLCREAASMGDWVMLAAMSHTEAGQLHIQAGKPAETRIGTYPWQITLSQAPQTEDTVIAQTEERAELPEGTEEKLAKALAFRYAHTAATKAPSKQTATDRKNRQKDAEAAENAPERTMPARVWRQPGFRNRQTGGKNYGNAIHAAMQYIRYDHCGSVGDVEMEVKRLVEQGFLTQEQGDMVDCGSIARFFASDIGKKLRSGTNYLREFKFSILDPGEHYGDGLEGERVLLQGVVDCALLEEDGITVLDFKSDHVTEETLNTAVERYRIQVQTYAQALSRIYEMPVKESNLYFFRLNRFVKV